MEHRAHQTASTSKNRLDQHQAKQFEQDQRISQIQAQNDNQITAARAAEDSVEEFSRVASGFRGHVLPAPALYDLLAALKLTLYSLESVAQFLPRGLANSLDEPSITVIEGALLGTDVPRDPAQQVTLTISHLETMRDSISEAAQHAERAQAAISSQGYIPNAQAPASTQPHQHETTTTKHDQGSQGLATPPKQERNVSTSTGISGSNSLPPSPSRLF